MSLKHFETFADDLFEIKKIIAGTQKSFSALSRIFIYWGILFTAFSLVNWIQTMNYEATRSFFESSPIFIYAIPGLVGVAAYLIMYLVTKKQPMIGLEKNLFFLWLLILIMVTIPGKINIISGVERCETLVLEVNNFSILIFGLDTALITTALFTDFKHLKLLGLIYISYGLANTYLNLQVLSSLTQIVQYFVLPASMVYTGLYLKKQHERGFSNGHTRNT